MTKKTRTKFLIDKRLQTKYFVLTILLLLTYTFMFALFLFLPYILPLQFGDSLQEQTKAARMILNLHQSIWPALGAVMLVLGTISIFVTHKIAGPSYRIKQDLASIMEGNLDLVIRLRKGDDLKELAASVNQFVDEMRSAIDIIRQDSQTTSSCTAIIENLIEKKQLAHQEGESLLQLLRNTEQSHQDILDKYSNSSD